MERFAALIAGEVGEEYVDLSVGLAREAAAGVLGEENLGVTPKRVGGGERLDGGYIEDRAAEVAGVEEFD